jgi:hypothetical protein
MPLSRLIIVLACAAGLTNPVAFAQDGPTQSEPLDMLEDALGSVENPLPKANEVSNEELLGRLTDLREVVRDMQRILDEKLVAIQQLEDENEKLRQALRLRFGGAGGGLPPVPIANRELIESVLREGPPEPERMETRGAPTAQEAFTVVSEWGRSPEVAASLPGEVSSLIGMTIAVDRQTGPDALQQLGTGLRANYAHYDNINIEVFDDIGAARTYADKGSLDERRRVLSVTRFKHSGRDDVVVYQNGTRVPGL